MVEIEHQTLAVRDLTPHDRTAMFRLMQEYYLGVSRETFEYDLAEKEHVMVLRDRTEGDRLVGFSTLMRLNLVVCGNPVKAIFSGDTVVEEQKRNNIGFAYEVTRYFAQTMSEFPEYAAYYVLICKGWRTYRILPFLFRNFTPRFDKPAEPMHRRVMDAFCAKKYPREYNPETGLIVFDGETQRIKPNSAEAISQSRRDKYAGFFAEKNPYHLRGDELVCVAPVTCSNFTRAFNKLLEARQEVYA
jgi:hypothetical protein